MINFSEILKSEESLDPKDWDNMKAVGIKMVEDMFDYLKNVSESPVWRKTPNLTIANLSKSLPQAEDKLETIYEEFKTDILPFNKGNIHPRFWGWAIGTGTPLGILSEMLAAAMNPDLCMGGHSPMYVEQQVVNWMKEFMGFSPESSGILVSGTSTANLTGLLVARDYCTDQKVRAGGIKEFPKQLVIYTSSETHSCIAKAADMIGIGRNFVRIISVDSHYRMNVKELHEQVKLDKKKGMLPFCVVANVGTVNTGAIDPLKEIYEVCKKEDLWFHVDGAFGALAKLVPEYQKRLQYINYADSLAFDLHKWMSMPMGIGCLLVKDKAIHRHAFAIQPDYLAMHERGILDGLDPNFNYGIEMTRNFRALSLWMGMKHNGIKKITGIIRQNIAQAFYLESLIMQEDFLELMATVSLNIVCFRFNPGDEMSSERLNKLNKEIVMEMQEKGLAAISHTQLNGNYVLRVANVNHRSKKSDFEFLVSTVIEIGNVLKSTIE